MNKNMFAHRLETTISQHGVLRLDALPFTEGEVVEVIILKKADSSKNAQQRTVGEYVGQIKMTEDFSVPLTDDFWLGQSS